MENYNYGKPDVLYVCFISAKEVIRDLLASLSNIVFEVLLAKGMVATWPDITERFT